MGGLLGPALRMLISLAIVIALMYVAARLLRRTHGSSSIRMPRVRSADDAGVLRTLVSSITTRLSGRPADASPSVKSPRAARRPARRRSRLEVLARQPLGKSASVAVLRVAGRTLLVGVTEHSVQLLSEVDATAFDNIETSVVSEQPTLRIPDAEQPPTLQQAMLVNGSEDTSADATVSVMNLLRERTVRRA
jgi:flagellar biogenesis protein FliO